MAPSSPAVRIVPATLDDVPVILSLIKALAEYERMSADVVATEDGLREALFGDRPRAEVVMARVGESTVGFALFFHSFSTFLGRAGLYLEDLFVVPEWRSHGVGRALLGHLARTAVDRGCGRLEWSVLNWNTPAIGFYERIGARPMSDWTVYRLTGDALKRLSQQTGLP